MTKASAYWGALVFAALACQGCVEGGCNYNADRNAELPMEGVKRIVIDASLGTLDVRGEPARSMLAVKGRACAAREATLDEIKLETERVGDTLRIKAVLPEHAWSWFDALSGGLGLDLVVTAPVEVALEITDSSGPIEVSNVGPTKIDDSSGPIRVVGVAGDLEVDDSSGSVEVRDVRGDLTLADSSGSVSVIGVSGGVHVPEDGSGSLAVRDVGGNVVVDQDGSGSIRIANVQGGVTIGDDGSGSIDIDDVKGDVVVRSDGSGSISVVDVGGSLNVGDDGSGEVQYARVSGNVHIPSH